jgi:peptidyl-prolyl cis-trans isomerase A (cyclophilin A)
MLRAFHSALFLACLALATACGSDSDSATKTGDHATGAATGDAAPSASGLPDRALLMNPRDPKMNEQAPDTFRTLFHTTVGDFVVEVHRAWAPIGADRFYNLSKSGFFDGVKFFRVMKGFMVQFGIHGDPQVSRYWSTNNLQDDPVTQKNRRGTITYAKTGAPNSRSTQFFINYVDNSSNLDPQGFAPFGEVVEGMDVVDSIFAEYGGTPSGYQREITRDGNAFLDQNFPKLDSIITARLVD